MDPLESNKRSTRSGAILKRWQNWISCLTFCPVRLDTRTPALTPGLGIPIRAHVRYTRLEILAAFNVGNGARPMNWQSGVLYAQESDADLFAFTLDKTSRGFSPTTRYRDYVYKPGPHPLGKSVEYHCRQSNRSAIYPPSDKWVKYRSVRERSDQRALWCLGTARYRSHEGERPIAFVWELDIPLPAHLFTVFAAAVA